MVWMDRWRGRLLACSGTLSSDRQKSLALANLLCLQQMIANFFFGVGSMIIFGMATTMLTEFMPKNASAGVALNNFMRNIFSCVGSLVTAPIIDAIGNGWLFTILGLVAFASSSTLYIMRVFGPRWRKSMDALTQ